MDDSSKPHRVIYLHCGKTATRVFPNLGTAEEFAKNYPGSTIQLATEKPNIVPRCANMMNSSVRTNRVMCDCGLRTRLTSEPYCFGCSGRMEDMTRNERVTRVNNRLNSIRPTRRAVG